MSLVWACAMAATLIRLLELSVVSTTKHLISRTLFAYLSG
jgi:hypothetical protein